MTTRKYTSRSQQTTLSSAVTSGATVLPVVAATTLLAGTTLSSGQTFTVVIDPDTALEEVVDIYSATGNPVSGLNLSVTRGVDGSTAQDHAAGAVVRHMIIGRDLRESNTHIETGIGVHGLAATSSVVGTLDTQTLSAKTLTTPTINGATITGSVTSTATITGGTITGAVVTGISSSGLNSSDATPKSYVDAILGSSVAAATSATSAATSASSAATSASSAATSASSAATSAASSLTSQGSSATSATSAANSASAASTSASSASTSASSAATSANSAATSATSAASYLSSVQTSATSASNSASAAASSATSASASATAAASSATAAATSAASAAASTSAAATSASSAASSASAAATSATSAATSASSAATSASSAATSATSAATSASSALTSQTAAATSASSAATSATSAATSASSALTSQTAAATSASSAATSATLAQDWAIKTTGTVDGSDYSAKYWAQQANPSGTLNASAYTAKGVVLVGTGTGTYTQLTIASTNGYVLSVDSSTTSGVKWETPPVLKSGSTMTGELILSTSTPTTSLSAVSKSYVDGLVQGLTWKAAVNLFATSNVALTGSSGTLVIDSHAALNSSNNGYRLLLTGQSTAADNGIYTYSDAGAGYTLARSTDADVYTELIGATVFVNEGTTYGKTTWTQSNHYLTSFSGQVWTQTAGAGTYTGTAPISVTGTTISHNTSGVTANTYTAATITVNATGHITSASASDLSAYADTIMTLMGAYL